MFLKSRSFGRGKFTLGKEWHVSEKSRPLGRGEFATAKELHASEKQVFRQR